MTPEQEIASRRARILQLVGTVQWAIDLINHEDFDLADIEPLSSRLREAILSSQPIEPCGHPGTCQWWEERGLPAVKMAGEALKDILHLIKAAGWDERHETIKDARKALEALRKDGLA